MHLFWNNGIHLKPFKDFVIGCYWTFSSVSKARPGRFLLTVPHFILNTILWDRYYHCRVEKMCTFLPPPNILPSICSSVRNGRDDAVRVEAVVAESLGQGGSLSLRLFTPPRRSLGTAAWQAPRGNGAFPRFSDNPLWTSVKCLPVYKGMIFKRTYVFLNLSKAVHI